MTNETIFSALRHELHQHPELSGAEFETGRRIADRLAGYQPDLLVRHLGGNGVAAVYEATASGPTILLRCELDALPIAEETDLPYRSRTTGVAHLCGHDGHMAILVSVAAALARKPPRRGKVVLLFQPAEEIGSGAAAVLDDPQFQTLRPDYSFALHNLPGFDLGQVVIRSGTFCCASRGMTVRLTGASCHAAQPESGRSPTMAMVHFMQQLFSLPRELTGDESGAFATIIGARLGQKAFGTTPDQAEVWVTLRAETDGTMRRLVEFAERTISDLAAADGLGCRIDYEDIFPATVNSPRAVQQVWAAAAGKAILELDRPFRWSEDFGRLSAISEGALVGLGAGQSVPDLHQSNYDFPDELIPIGRDLLLNLLAQCQDLNIGMD